MVVLLVIVSLWLSCFIGYVNRTNSDVCGGFVRNDITSTDSYVYGCFVSLIIVCYMYGLVFTFLSKFHSGQFVDPSQGNTFFFFLIPVTMS